MMREFEVAFGCGGGSGGNARWWRDGVAIATTAQSGKGHYHLTVIVGKECLVRLPFKDLFVCKPLFLS